MTADLEVMTLTGVPVYKEDKNNLEKRIFPWGKDNIPPPEVLRKVKETQKHRTSEFLSTLLNQELEPNYRPKEPCAQPALRPINNKETFRLASNPESFRPITSEQTFGPINAQQNETGIPPPNIFTLTRKVPTRKNEERSG